MRKSEKATQRATAITLAAALAVAVYLNWEYAKVNPDLSQDVQANADVVETSAQEMETMETAGVLDGLMTEQEVLAAADKTYGEAQLVSVSADAGSEFFEEARLNRTKTRDAVLEQINKSLQKASLSAEEKAELTTELSACLANTTDENEIETLIKAKGMADCICFLENGKANLTVMTEGKALDGEQVAQIRDIVLRKCDIPAQNITVVEVN